MTTHDDDASLLIDDSAAYRTQTLQCTRAPRSSSTVVDATRLHRRSTRTRTLNYPYGCTGFSRGQFRTGRRRVVVVSRVRRMNEVNAHRARLVLGCVTVFGWVYHLGM